MESNVMMTIYDSKGRILVVQKKIRSGFSYVFLRYPNMDDSDKKASKVVFETISINDRNMATQAGTPIDDIDKFLNFQDDSPDLCG